MHSLLAALARSLTTHWKRGLAGLLLTVLAIGVVIGTQGGDSAAQDFAVPGTESQAALDLLQEQFPAASGASSQVVFTTATGQLTDPARRAAIGRSVRALAELPDVTGVPDPLGDGGAVSKDGRTAFTTVQYATQGMDMATADGKAFERAARAGEQDGVRVAIRGEVADLAAQQDAPVGELIGVVIAIVLLTVLFRSIAAMVVTLLGALVGVVLSQLILQAVKGPLAIPDFATTLAVMLGLGAGIDYALLIFSRFREQLAEGETPSEASARANATSGTSVVAAGAIVMVAIAGLLTVGIPLVGRIGIGSAIAVAGVVLSSVVVLPILAGALARWLHPKDPAHVARSEGFERWGRLLVARPWIPVVVGGLVLVVLAVPFTDMRLGQPDDGNTRVGDTRRTAYDQLSEAFGPGFNGPLLLAVSRAGGGRIDTAALDALRAPLARTPGVAEVAPPVLNEAGDTAIVNLTPTTSPQDAATSELVQRLREDVLPDATRRSDLRVHLGGQTAGFEDFSDRISARLPVFIAIVVGLSIVLLIAVFRSIWVPLVSAAFNLLSIGAAYGVIVAVFQWGWGASLIGVDGDTPIISFIPLFMFAILFGLSMDYNVFLLSRIREAYFEGDGPKESVVHGLSRIAKVILVAGLIMAAVFLAFVSGPDVLIKMFGLGLGAAILIDVLIVRMIVSPALMAVLGNRAWWMPHWLDRVLPDVSLEGGADQREPAKAAA